MSHMRGWRAAMAMRDLSIEQCHQWRQHTRRHGRISARVTAVRQLLQRPRRRSRHARGLVRQQDCTGSVPACTIAP